MSGGGGGGSSEDNWRVGGNPLGGENSCIIVEQTILNSPNQAVISALSIGEILQVTLETQPRNRLVVKNNNDIAGAITSPRIVDLIECIQNGNDYVAEIISINNGRVEVEIRNT